LTSAHVRLARLLVDQRLKVVFAESCTAGLASALLAKVPGISEHHCGGMVVYRNETKQQYLGISARLLAQHGAVSERIAREMAERVLQITPEADYAASVTGHLGPNAPAEQDGLVFMAITGRGKARATVVHSMRCLPNDRRSVRQKKVAIELLRDLAERIKQDRAAF
jgi:nicotinamide-nucleotide amidase